MKNIGKVIKISNSSNIYWKQELFKFLRNYRSCPHSSTNIAPAQIIFNRKFRTKIPEYRKELTNPTDIRKTDERSKAMMKNNFDNNIFRKKMDLKTGDKVLVKNRISGKSQPFYDPVPLKITQTKGTMITAANDKDK